MTTADGMLTNYADRLERLLDEADELREGICAVKEEAKNNGFNVPALVALVQMRRNAKKAERESERINMIALYADKLGVQLSLALPIAKAARTLRELGATVSSAEDLAGEAADGMRRLRAEAAP